MPYKENRSGLWLFMGIFILYLLFLAMDNSTGQWITKPLLLPALLFYFVSSVESPRSIPAIYVFIALFFSWAGDVLLMFQERNSLFFLLGLSAFLLAHIGYIFFFFHLRKTHRLPLRPYLLVAVLVYYVVLITILSPFLGEMKWPVRVYGLVISTMLMLAAHSWFLPDRRAGSFLCNGALLFVISDSLLAVNKFYQPFSFAGLAIMITYGGAQLFITEGAKQYLRRQKAKVESKL